MPLKTSFIEALPSVGRESEDKVEWKKQREKINNIVLFDQAIYDKLLSEVPKFKLTTLFILSDHLTTNESQARRATKQLMAHGSIRMVYAHASQQMPMSRFTFWTWF